MFIRNSVATCIAAVAAGIASRARRDTSTRAQPVSAASVATPPARNTASGACCIRSVSPKSKSIICSVLRSSSECRWSAAAQPGPFQYSLLRPAATYGAVMTVQTA